MEQTVCKCQVYLVLELYLGTQCTEIKSNQLIERLLIDCRNNCFGFALLHSVIGSKFCRHFFNQSEVKPKPIVARACTFSRALCRLRVITLSFDRFTGLSPSFLIGQSNYFVYD